MTKKNKNNNFGWKQSNALNRKDNKPILHRFDFNKVKNISNSSSSSSSLKGGSITPKETLVRKK